MLLPFLAFCGSVRPDADTLRSHAQRVRQAMALADLKIEGACRDMDLDQGQFCRQLAGEGHISLTRMALLPDVFWQWYGLLLAEDYGLPLVVIRAGRVWLALRARKQLRMTAGSQSDKRRIA